GEMGDIVLIGEELRPDFHLGGDNGFDGRGASILQHFQRDLRGWRVLVYLVAALHQAQQGWSTRLGGGSTAQLNPAWSGGTVASCGFTGQRLAARLQVARLRFHLLLQSACW